MDLRHGQPGMPGPPMERVNDVPAASLLPSFLQPSQAALAASSVVSKPSSFFTISIYPSHLEDSTTHAIVFSGSSQNPSSNLGQTQRHGIALKTVRSSGMSFSSRHSGLL